MCFCTASSCLVLFCVHVHLSDCCMSDFVDISAMTHCNKGALPVSLSICSLCPLWLFDCFVYLTIIRPQSESIIPLQRWAMKYQVNIFYFCLCIFLRQCNFFNNNHMPKVKRNRDQAVKSGPKLEMEKIHKHASIFFVANYFKCIKSSLQRRSLQGAYFCMNYF